MIKSIVPIDTIQGDNMYFKRLRDLREDHDMKQSEVAEYLGIQQTVYSRYERGFQSIPVEHLIKLADCTKFPQITFSAENSCKLKSGSRFSMQNFCSRLFLFVIRRAAVPCS